MNPLKSSSTQQYNRIDNRYSNVILPVKRLPTTGDGNCLIHALFGEFSYVQHPLLEEVQQKFFHKNAPAVRFEIAHKLFNQGEGNHAIYEELYSIDELGSATFSPININNLALSLEKNGEYLGLEHAHLIAKAFKLNIRVYYPKSHAYEKIDLFHRDSNTQEVDRIVYFNGIDHWEKCELSNEPGLPSSLDFISDESTSASSRQSSFDLRPKPQPNPKYSRIFENNANYSPSERIKVNNRAILVLKCKNHNRMKNSYLFKFCKPQKYNERFLNTFADFFQYLRGSDPLAMSAGYALANKFREYKDVCDTNWEFNHDDHINRWEVIHSPTSELIAELKQIIEEEHGLKDFFFETLQRNHFRISEEYKLEDRDAWLRGFPVFPRVYPRCANVLKDVFTDLLSVKWLENDINGLKYYLDQNTSIERPLDLGKLLEAERVWKLVKQAVDAKINQDEKLNKHFYDELKKDIKNLGISSLVSLVPGCGAAFLGGVGRTVINTLGNYADPEGKQTSVQMMKLLGGSGLGKLMGGDVFELGTSLGVDLVEFYVRDEKTTKNEGTALSVYTSVLKGLCTGDKQKLIAQVLGTCVAETAERVDDKDAPLDIKIVLALLKNPDARGLIVNDIVNEFSKEKPKEDTGQRVEVDPDSESQFPKQVIKEAEPEQIIKESEQLVKVEMQNERLYLRLVEEQKQNQADLKLAQTDCEAKRQAAEKASKKEQNLHKKNTGFKLIPKPKLYQEWLDSKETLATKNGEYQTSQCRVGEIQEKMYKNSKAQLVASTPKIPTTQTDKGLATSITNLNRIDREIPEKILAVEKSIDNYNEHHRKDSYFSEVKRTIKDLNSSFKERDTEQNNINRLNGVESKIETPLIEIPKKASALAKIILWCKDNVVLGIHPPTQPFNYDPNKPIPPESNKGSTYHETRHQINVEKSELNVLEEKSKPVSQGSNWSSVSQYHSHRMFETNMAHQSPSISTPSQPLNFGTGVANNVQIPPSDLSGLGRNDQTLCNTLQGVSNREMQMAGLSPNEIIKTIPYPIKRDIDIWVKNYAQEIKDNPIKSKKDMAICLILGAKKVLVVAIQAFEQPSLKTRPNAFGLMEVSESCDRCVAQKLDVALDSSHAKLGLLMGEIAMPMPLIGGLKPCMKVGEEAFAFMRQANKLMKPHPLMDRMLAFPQGFSKEIRAIEALQNPVYRSGFVHNKAIQQARKAVNLPAWQKMPIKMDHVLSGHTGKGWRTGCKGNKKSLFPEAMTKKQIENAIRQAYRYGKKVQTQEEVVVIIGEYQGMKIKMYVNTEKKIIESAYPKK
jgi:hypothetical protein